MIDYCNSNDHKPEWLFILHNKEQNIKIPLVRGINEVTSDDLLGLSNSGLSAIVFKINIHSYERATLRVYDTYPVIIRVENEFFKEKIQLDRSCLKAIRLVENIEIQALNMEASFGKFALQKFVEEDCMNTLGDNKTISADFFSKSGLLLLEQNLKKTRSLMLEDTCQDSFYEKNNLDRNVKINNDLLSFSKTYSSQINVDKLNKFLDNKIFAGSNIIVTNPKRKRRRLENPHLNVVENFFTKNDLFNKEDDHHTICRICLDNISSIAKIVRCGHQFCKECLFNWARLSNTCPLCKKQFKKMAIWRSERRRYEYKAVSYKKYLIESEESDDWIERCMKKCMKCNKDEENYLMLVCDKCNYNVCHTYCDGLDRIPDGDWYCPKCRIRNDYPIS